MRQTIIIVCLFSMEAWAQPFPTNCSVPSATCRSKHFVIATGGDLLPPSDLGASLGSASKRFATGFIATIKDGGSINRLIANTVSGNVYVDGINSSGGSDIAHLFNTHIAYSASGSLLAAFENTAVIETTIDKDGNIRASAAGGVSNPVPTIHAAQTINPVAEEFGSAAATAGGALTIAFQAAFSSAPICVCSDQNAAPVSCGVSTAANGSGVTFTIGSARADTVNWICIGAK